ncbi:MAG: AAA family ATPase, partial [Spirochaetes bacterium]|nr:AAA family ATPase [Spirochaetota bacterium]
MSLKSSISGIRGIVGQSLTPQVIVDYVSAFSSVLNDGKILIGRDSRASGQMIKQIIKGVLNATGRSVVDIGIVPTPVVLFGVANGDFAGGIIITASHNPEEWNALKLVNEKGKFLSPNEFINLSKKYEDGLLALDNVNFTVNAGEVFAMLGGNGAGKTTFLNAITWCLYGVEYNIRHKHKALP